MKQPEARQKRLIQVFEKGAELCLRQLGKISGAAWGTEAVFLGEASQEQLHKLFAGSLEDCWGNWFTSQGAAFLIIFSRKPGMVVSGKFTRSSKAADALENRDAKAIAEVSNILVNGFASALADAIDRDLIVSEPHSMTDSRRELIARGLKTLVDPAKLGASCLVRLLSPGLVTEFSVIALLDQATLDELKS